MHMDLYSTAPSLCFYVVHMYTQTLWLYVLISCLVYRSECSFSMMERKQLDYTAVGRSPVALPSHFPCNKCLLWSVFVILDKNITQIWWIPPLTAAHTITDMMRVNQKGLFIMFSVPDIWSTLTKIRITQFWMWTTESKVKSRHVARFTFVIQNNVIWIHDCKWRQLWD